jgi:hypothetical protein
VKLAKWVARKVLSRRMVVKWNYHCLMKCMLAGSRADEPMYLKWYGRIIN